MSKIPWHREIVFDRSQQQGWSLSTRPQNQLSASIWKQQQNGLYNQMNNFQEQTYNLWKNRWELAVKGDEWALDQIKSNIRDSISKDHPLFSCSFKALLQQSTFHQIQEQKIYGPFELYTAVPKLIILEGHVQLQCINLEGDNDVIATVSKAGLLEIDELQLRARYGETNVTLVTQFQIVGLEKSVLIELNSKSFEGCLKKEEARKQVSLREEAIMRKYMIIALKHITKLTYSKGTPLSQRFYLLQGRTCLYHFPTKTILCCYEEGLFNPADMQSTTFRLHVFEGAYLLILEGEMLKDQVASGVELKRSEHLGNIWKKYEKMPGEEKAKLQEKLIQKYSLNRIQVCRQILAIEKMPEKAADKRVKSKNDLINTTTSMKQKCGIRIRKSKRVA